MNKKAIRSVAKSIISSVVFGAGLGTVFTALVIQNLSIATIGLVPTLIGFWKAKTEIEKLPSMRG